MELEVYVIEDTAGYLAISGEVMAIGVRNLRAEHHSFFFPSLLERLSGTVGPAAEQFQITLVAAYPDGPPASMPTWVDRKGL